jgi:hypothetical protein
MHPALNDGMLNAEQFSDRCLHADLQDIERASPLPTGTELPEVWHTGTGGNNLSVAARKARCAGLFRQS